MSSPEKTYSDVQMAFQNGTVLSAGKFELEQYLMALARTNVHSEANRRRTEHMGNTIGLLLMARQSEEAQSKATVISVIAMLISIVALVCSGLQAYLEYASFRRSEAPSPAASQLVSPAQSTPVQSPK